MINKTPSENQIFCFVLFFSWKELIEECYLIFSSPSCSIVPFFVFTSLFKLPIIIEQDSVVILHKWTSRRYSYSVSSQVIVVTGYKDITSDFYRTRSFSFYILYSVNGFLCVTEVRIKIYQLVVPCSLKINCW